MHHILPVLLLLISSSVFAQRQTATAVFTGEAPHINGILDDPAWDQAEVITGFKQVEPWFGKDARFRSEVKILYDNRAVYVGAYLSDPHPDSIPRQLGDRDDELNADLFGVEFDTYNNQLDAFSFRVYSSDVQCDFRENDEAYSAVWQSAVKISKDGWYVEMAIPYSAIRFPAVPEQTWGLQVVRTVRRFRETEQWSPEPRGTENDLAYWGELKGIRNIEPPTRLSLNPYMTVSAEHFPQENPELDDVSSSFGGGLDMKAGLNESFTLDVTLLPDFSQVQSDNKVKNLTAFETIYTEQRPLFNEASDLFNKGDIFYTRRIGKTPMLFDQAAQNSILVKNPVQQKLLNVSKLSGRSRTGLALGIINAVTANTWAVERHEATGAENRILTDPATNYNVFVLDQSLKNNSSIYLNNTSVLRAKGFDDAVVTASGININNRKNTFLYSLNGAVSQRWQQDEETSGRSRIAGFKYFAGMSKTNGNLHWTLLHGAVSPKYDANDLGITLYNNYRQNYAVISYEMFEPRGKLLSTENSLELSNLLNYTTNKPQATELEYNFEATFVNHMTVWAGAGWHFLKEYDYYEPRSPGRYYRTPRSLNGMAGFSTDYRKPFAFDLMLKAYSSLDDIGRNVSLFLHPIARLSDHLSFDFSSMVSETLNDIGYATDSVNGDIIFGRRDVPTFENILNGRYMFKNNLSLSIRLRHYWSAGSYDRYYRLRDDGSLEENYDLGRNTDFNFNSFNIDMLFSWIFAPGSSLNLSWKNSMLSEQSEAVLKYIDNLEHTLESPQLNAISLKVLYYLDYQALKKK